MAATACSVLPDRWFTPHCAVYVEFALSAWEMLLSKGLGLILPFDLLVGFKVLIALGRLSLMKFNISGMFTFGKLVLFLSRFVSNFRLCNSPDVDSSWLLWSREAEASLAGAYLSAGGPPLSNPRSYVGRGSLSIETMRLGGRCHDRIYHVDRADQFDVNHSGFFLNSSLAPVLRFRRSFVSVCNVLTGIRLHGLSEAKVAALWCRWRKVVRMGPTGPVTSFDPGLIGFLLISMDLKSGPWTPQLFLTILC